jgi:hypothetical protein
MKIIHGQRRWKKRLRCWKAQCASCNRFFSVRNDGQIKLLKNRWTERKRGHQKGELLGDTAARITMAAYLMLQRWSKGRIAAELYPLHGTKSAAKNAAYNSIFKPHDESITREKNRLAGLSHAIQLAAFEAAKSKISKPWVSRVA